MTTRLPAPVWAFAGAKIAFHLATTRLGFHRDELYFIAASKRVAASYVDFQPAVPLLVAGTRAVFGDSIWGIRLIPALAGAVTIVLAALLARELGGGARAQAFAGFAALVIPFFAGANSALNTIGLEMPAWMAVAVLLARIARTDDAKLWLWAGIAVGIALLVKFTVLAYLAAIPIAVLATPMRRHLRTPWPWVGALIAGAIVAPSLAWQFGHGLPVVEFVRNQSTGGRVLGLSGRAGYIASLVIFPGPVGLFLLIPGFRRLITDVSHRAIAVATVVPIIVFFAVSGKGYYAAPALAVALIAGAVVVVKRREKSSRTLLAALVVNLLIALPLLVPLVPVSVLRDSADIAQATEMGERIGWEELAAQVDAIARDLDHPVVIGSNYAIPAAIELYGNTDDLGPVVSGHNSAYLWWPRAATHHTAIAIGFEARMLEGLYDDIERVGTVRNSDGVHNYEWGDPIFVVRDAKVSWTVLRERLQRFTA